MTRLLFGQGSRGGIVKRIQQRLNQEGHYMTTIDGWFGIRTVEAVIRYQTLNHMPAIGAVDDVCWRPLMKCDIPTVYERCLQLTAALEGHDFGHVSGNWDGAWLTWGIIGFTLKHGSLSRIILEVYEQDNGIVKDAFGSLTERLMDVMAGAPSNQETWANEISIRSNKLHVDEAWRAAFKRFGEQEVVQRTQIHEAQRAYFLPCLTTARRYGLSSEQGVALCFDIHVQNGRVKPKAAEAIHQALQSRPALDEVTRRIIIANAVADCALPAFRGDVRARKLALAIGSGKVHGEDILLCNWGLADYPCEF
jgi:peptidoglycan hydrolase-like protein with peptidoglycan-binding domain